MSDPVDDICFHIRVIRRRFLESVASVLLVLAIIGLPVYLSRVFQTDLNFNHIMHIIISMIIIGQFFLRRRLGDQPLVSCILFVFTALSLTAFIQYGIVSAGFFFAAASTFVAGLTLGLWGGIIFAGFFAAIASVMAYLWMSGSLVFPSDVGQ